MYPFQNYTPMYQGNYHQNDNFIPVRSEAEAFSYPMELGKSLTFKNETAPYIYTKTMGTSPLDQPKFDIYRLVKEEPHEAISEPADNKPLYATKDELQSLTDRVEALQDIVEGLKKKPVAKKVNDNDSE